MLVGGRQMFGTMLERGALAPDAMALARRQLAEIDRELADSRRPSFAGCCATSSPMPLARDGTGAGSCEYRPPTSPKRSRGSDDTRSVQRAVARWRRCGCVDVAPRRLPRRPRVQVALGAGLLAACGGALAAHSPVLLIVALAGATIAAVVLANLTLGIVILTLASFTGSVNLGGAATAPKAIGFLVIVSWVATLAARGQRFRRDLLADHGALLTWAFLFLIWNVLSAAWAHSASTAVAGASRYAQDMALLPIVYTGVRSPRHVRWVLSALVAQRAAVRGVWRDCRRSRQSRQAEAGTFDDPNETAMVLVAATGLALALAAAAAQEVRSPGPCFCWVLSGRSAASSRPGLAAASSASPRWCWPASRSPAAGAGERSAPCSCAPRWASPGSWYWHRPAPASTSPSTDSSGRSTLWLVAGRAIEAHPIAGLGTDNFQLQSSNYLVAPGVTTGASHIITRPQVAHNIYLEILVRCGHHRVGAVCRSDRRRAAVWVPGDRAPPTRRTRS